MNSSRSTGISPKGARQPQSGQHIARGNNSSVSALCRKRWLDAASPFSDILDLLELGADFPGVAYASQRGVWTSLSPDPSLLLGIPADRFPPQKPTFGETLAARPCLIGEESEHLVSAPAQNCSRVDAVFV